MRQLIALLFLLSSFCVCTPAQNIPENLNKYLEARTRLGRFSGAVLVARGKEVLFEKGYGFADVEQRRAYTPTTPEPIASLSKMFTAMAVLKLRDAGKLKLDDPICAHLSNCPDSWTPITIQEVLRHTSGIPDYEEALELGSDKYLAFMQQPNASAKILENAKKLPLDFPPGSKFHYSNTGYVALGYMVEQVSGRPFAEYVTDALQKPAGMTGTGIFVLGKVEGLALPYTYGDIGWQKMLAGFNLTDGTLQRLPVLPLTSPEGDAGMYSTVKDLLKWSVVMDGGSLVSIAETEEVFTPGLSGYGYGWIIDTVDGKKRYRHTGILPGYASEIVKFPEDKITIVVLCNVDRARLKNIVDDIASIVFGKAYDMPVEGNVKQLTDEIAAPLVGDYKFADGTTLSITRDPAMLAAAVPGKYQAGLIALSDTEFYMPMTEGHVTFSGEQGKPAQKVNLRYSGQDHVAVRVEK
jgi:CubicO group peptidase (beta-lactamase class C family)